MESTDILILLVIVVVGIFSTKRVWNWLSNKQFNVIEKHKWLKLLISVLCGFVLCGFVIVFGVIKLALRLTDAK